MGEVMKLHLTEHELNEVRGILRCALSGEQKVIAFGSRVKGTHRPTSDLDLAIAGDTSLSLALRSKLEFGFSESDLPFRVDVVDLTAVEPAFRAIIESEGVPLIYS